MKNCRKFLKIDQYDANTIEYENYLTILIASSLCFFFALLNIVYFSILYTVGTKFILTNSLILSLFGAIFLGCHFILKNENIKSGILQVISAAIALFFVVVYYPVIGPTVWTYSFIVIVITLLRQSIKSITILSIEFFLLGIYIWNSGTIFLINNNYYLSQFVAFSVLFVVTICVFRSNENRNLLIAKQFHEMEIIAHNLKISNVCLEQSIEANLDSLSKLDISENRLRSIVNAMPDVFFKLNREGVFLECEGGRDVRLLVEPKDFIGKKISDVLPSNIAQASLERIEITLDSHTHHIYEYQLEEAQALNYYEVRFVDAGLNEVYAILRNITELKEKERYIEYLSYHDQLTTLYNRRFLEEEIKRLDTERNLPLTIAMVDINGLKLTNDSFGHHIGDKLLIKVSEILRSECRADDIIARVGGDEFVLLLPKTPYKQAESIVKRLYSTIAEEQIDTVVLSVSIGFETKVNEEELIENILIKAEEKMYGSKLTESQSMRNQTIQVILKTLNEKSEREKIHSQNVSIISRKIGEALNLENALLKELEVAGLMHDIGKISINESILNKKDALTDLEYEEIKRHPESSYYILKSTDKYSSLADIALSHHERWDGNGYPRGLKGEQIPLLARIISVADSYEAMTADRPYRKAVSHEDALNELNKNSGTQFDEAIVRVFQKIIIELENKKD